jgi:hypothetical protein
MIFYKTLLQIFIERTNQINSIISALSERGLIARADSEAGCTNYHYLLPEPSPAQVQFRKYLLDNIQHFCYLHQTTTGSQTPFSCHTIEVITNKDKTPTVNLCYT